MVTLLLFNTLILKDKTSCTEEEKKQAEIKLKEKEQAKERNKRRQEKIKKEKEDKKKQIEIIDIEDDESEEEITIIEEIERKSDQQENKVLEGGFTMRKVDEIDMEDKR